MPELPPQLASFFYSFWYDQLAHIPELATFSQSKKHLMKAGSSFLDKEYAPSPVSLYNRNRKEGVSSL